MRALLAVAFLTIAFQTFAARAPWPQFRGPNASGVAANEKPPLEFGPQTNLLWKTVVPSGLSSPALGGGRIFLTGYEEGRLFALCFDVRTGRELWRKEAPPGKLRVDEIHKVSSPAVATPVTDGERAVAFFASFGLVAYDVEGRELWRKPLPVGFVMNGSGTSPVIFGDTVVLNLDQDEGESMLIALDARNGKVRWQTPRDTLSSSFTTPVLWRHDGRDEVVISGALRVTGYDLRSGKERWAARVTTSVSVAPTPVLGDGLIFVMSRGVPPNAMGTFAGFLERSDKNGDGKLSPEEVPDFRGGFRGIDRDKDGFISDADWTAMTNLFAKGDSGLFALRAPGEGDVTASHVAWKRARGVSAISSPLFYERRLYVVQDGGRVSCWNTSSGEPLYEQERLGADGEYYGSPVAANGHIYYTSNRGVVTATRAGDTLEVVARNAIGEPVMTTPALADDKIFIRGGKYLWAFGRR